MDKDLKNEIKLIKETIKKVNIENIKLNILIMCLIMLFTISLPINLTNKIYFLLILIIFIVIILITKLKYIKTSKSLISIQKKFNN